MVDEFLPAVTLAGDERFIGRAPVMSLVVHAATRAARQPQNVLICGEAGTGRELIARVIHEREHPAERPFVKVDCSRTPELDLETELFGIAVSGNHPRAVERRALERVTRAGRICQAIGGSLFLENVLALSRRVQIRLMRVLRDHEAIVQHEQEHVRFGARVLTAVDPSYDTALEDGRVSADLHAWLAGFRIDVPPLRNRREDIPALAAHLVGRICRDARVPGKTLSEAAQSLLAALPWRGNVAELRALLHGLVVRVPRNEIGLNDVLANVQLDGRAGRFTPGGSLREAREQFEREYITAVLEQHHGRIPDAARTLGIQRTNLYRKMKRLKAGRSADRK